MILAGFEHRPGLHCGSAAVADALRVRGVEVSEAMAFGLGAGLGFYHLHSAGVAPTHLLVGRSAHLERTACEVLGAPLREREEADPRLAWEGVREALDRGLAPVVATDVSELPYWRTRTRFGGHRVVVAGYDLRRAVAWIADGERPGIHEITLAELDRARGSVAPPRGHPGRPWLEIDAPERPRPLADAARDALRRQARDALIDVDGTAGVSALERFAAELPQWPARAASEADRSFGFRFGYQCIERRGTGGGNFRALYARFLEELEAAIPGLATLGLSRRMRALAAAWTRLAEALREISQVPGGTVPEAASELARAIARDERRYHEDVAALVR